MKQPYLKAVLGLFFLLTGAWAFAKDGDRQKDHLKRLQICNSNKVCQSVLIFDAHVYGPNVSEFLDQTKNLPAGTTVLLSGYGRDLTSGIILGEIIRQKQFNIWVGRVGASVPGSAYNKVKGVCISACAIAAMGGVKRQIDSDDEFGVTALEAIRNDLTEEQYQKALVDTQAYLKRMGIDNRFFEFLKDAQGRNLKWIEPPARRSYGIIQQ